MVYTFSLNPRLTDSQLQTMLKRFHFDRQDAPALHFLYQELLLAADAKCFFYINKKGDVPGIPYDSFAVAAVTLSSAADEYIQSKTDSGSISDAYMADCLALELLSRCYVLTAQRIHEVTGLWANACEFPGNEHPLSMTAGLLKRFPDIPICANKAGVMLPAKSVVYITQLTTEKPQEDCSHICKSCQNVSCPNRTNRSTVSFNP